MKRRCPSISRDDVRDSDEEYVALLCDDMREEMNGAKFCKIKELGRDCLLRYVMRVWSVAKCEVFDVSVVKLNGDVLHVKLPSGRNCNVRALKVEIQEIEGIPIERQDIFVDTGIVDIEEEKRKRDVAFDFDDDYDFDACIKPLSDDTLIEMSCEMVLYVFQPESTWDIESKLIAVSPHKAHLRARSLILTPH
jgi:hypothetical protein